MPISSTGNRSRGITLIEMMVVLAIISLIVAISFPSTIAALENIRLSSGARSMAVFLNVAANRADRLQQAIQLTVSMQDNTVTLLSADGAFARKLDLPPGVVVDAVLPPDETAGGQPRRFLFYPGGTPPRMAVELVNRKGVKRLVRLNPITGVTEITRPEAP